MVLLLVFSVTMTVQASSSNKTDKDEKAEKVEKAENTTLLEAQKEMEEPQKPI